MHNDISLDIETLDNTPTSVVLSIGAVRFNLDDEESLSEMEEQTERHFYTTLKVQPQIDLGRTISGGTVAWWMSQSEAARAVFKEAQPESNVQALQDFLLFCKGTVRLWGNGNVFDNIIIRDLCTDYMVPYPVQFWNDMDLRTLKLIAGVDKPSASSNQIKHNALDDAIYQAYCAQHYWGVIHGNSISK